MLLYKLPYKIFERFYFDTNYRVATIPTKISARDCAELICVCGCVPTMLCSITRTPVALESLMLFFVEHFVVSGPVYSYLYTYVSEKR